MAFGDYRDKFPPGTRIRTICGDREAVIVDIDENTAAGVPVKDHYAYRENKFRVWITGHGGGARWIAAENLIVLEPVKPAEPAEPACVCDVKLLFSVGCLCDYAKWKRERNKRSLSAEEMMDCLA